MQNNIIYYVFVIRKQVGARFDGKYSLKITQHKKKWGGVERKADTYFYCLAHLGPKSQPGSLNKS